jgi:putative phage-type endonuclease
MDYKCSHDKKKDEENVLDRVVTNLEQHEFLCNLIIDENQQECIMNTEQRTAAWLKHRHGRLTGSIAASAIGKNYFCKPRDLLKEILWKKFQGNEATNYGTKMEPVALERYNKIRKVKVKEVGLIINLTQPWLAYSPDGLLPDRLIEIKCPFKKRFYGKIPIYYYIQIQYGMWMTNRKLCDFVVYVPSGIQIQTYEYNAEYTENFILPSLNKFYFNKLLPLLVAKEKGLVVKGKATYAEGVIVENYTVGEVP